MRWSDEVRPHVYVVASLQLKHTLFPSTSWHPCCARLCPRFKSPEFNHSSCIYLTSQCKSVSVDHPFTAIPRYFFSTHIHKGMFNSFSVYGLGGLAYVFLGVYCHVFENKFKSIECSTRSWNRKGLTICSQMASFDRQLISEL